jgi:hypothetical protein
MITENKRMADGKLNSSVSGRWQGVGRDSSVGMATRYGLTVRGSKPCGSEIFLARPDRPRGPPRLLYKGYRVFPGGKAAGM